MERISAVGLAAADLSSDVAAPTTDVDAAAAAGALDIAIGDDTIGVAFLTRGVEAATSVVRLLVHRHFDGAPSFLAGNEPDFGMVCTDPPGELWNPDRSDPAGPGNQLLRPPRGGSCGAVRVAGRREIPLDAQLTLAATPGKTS